MLILFSGSSGVGKNTVINELLKRNKEFSTMPTITTRSPRAGESEGNPYFFVSKECFLEMIEAGELYEYEIVHGSNYYGTSKKIIDNLKGITLKDVDVKGAVNLKKILKKKVLTIFLYVERDELVKRLTGRGEKDIEKRLERFDLEYSYKGEFDYCIENIDLIKAVQECERLIFQKA